MIVAMTGRAGSGKTTLTRALTGVDTRGLSDETRGGMWVSPAHSYLSWTEHASTFEGGAGGMLAIVDGPSSIRLRQSHWAGVDVVVCTVDADGDIDAQTDAEAFCAQGCHAGLQCVVVLTRLDTLAPDSAERARGALRQRLRANGDADTIIFETCATDPFDEGVRALRHHLASIGAALASAAPSVRTIAVERVLAFDGGEIRQAVPKAAVASKGALSVVSTQQNGHWLLDTSDFSAWTAALLDGVRTHHARSPNDEGPTLSLLRKPLPSSVPIAAWRAMASVLCAQGQLVCSGACLQMPTHRRTAPESDTVPASGIVADLAAGRFNPPWVRDIATQRHLPEAQVRRILQQLAHEGRVYEVVPDLFYDRFQIAILARLLYSLAQLGVGSVSGAKGEVAAAIFRDATGVGRKRAIQILEFFDRIGFTQRVGDSHCVEPDSEWLQWFDIPLASAYPRAPVKTTVASAGALSEINDVGAKANC